MAIPRNEKKTDTSELPLFMEAVASKGEYSARHPSQYVDSSEIWDSFIPVLRSEPSSEAMIEPRLGCEVRPLMESTATSTTSAPARAAAIMAARKKKREHCH